MRSWRSDLPGTPNVLSLSRTGLIVSTLDMRKNPVSGLLVVLLVAPAAMLLASDVTIDYDKAADFSRIQRYQWRTHPAFEKHPELREKYATGIQLVLEAGNTELMKKGLRPSDRSPDVFLSFYLSSEDNEKVRVITEAIPGAWYGWYGQPAWTRTEVDYHKTGMMVLDVIDVGTSKLIWRAYCVDSIRDMRNRDKNVNSVVKKAFKNFPPKPK